MAGFEDLMKASPLQLLGLGVVGIALPLFVPALRPQFATVVKAGAKLFFEAELDADNALADLLVDATMSSLMALAPHGFEEDGARNTDQAIRHFVNATSKASHRRGFDAEDARRRYHRRLAKLEHALSRAKREARHGQRPVLDNALRLVKEHGAYPGNPLLLEDDSTQKSAVLGTPEKAPAHRHRKKTL